MRDFHNSLKIVPLYNPAAAVTDNTAQVSAIIDTANSGGVELAIQFGSLADVDATFTVLVEEGNVANLSDAAAVADADLLGTELLAAPLFSDDNKVCKIGYKGNKRYVRVTVTPAANSGNIFIAGVAILGSPRTYPQSAQKV